MRWLYHIVPAAEAVPDPYAPPSLSREGFVHASFRDEVQESARRYFPPGQALTVLQIDPRRLRAPLVLCDTPRGPMPHVHGPIDGAAIAARLPLSAIAAAPDSLDD